MASGDGLIVRIRAGARLLHATQLRAVAEHAGLHGGASGLIELTRRANLQLRGLTSEAVARLQRSCVELGLATPDAELERRLALLVHPLAGIEPAYAPLWALAAAVEQHLTDAGPQPGLPGKFSIVIDAARDADAPERPGTEPRPALLGISSHIRVQLSARSARASLHVASDGRSALRLGSLHSEEVPSAVVRLVQLHAAGSALLRVDPRRALDSFDWLEVNELSERAPGVAHAAPSFIGHHSACGDWFGLGVPFGSATADTWLGIAELAERYGHGAMRITPRRSIIVPGVSAGARGSFEEQCRRLGLICDPADPLLRVEACPGAPACASALGETRAFARALATALPLHAALTRGATLHVSGCDKGCACSGPASVTVVHAADGCKLGFSVDVAQLTAGSGSGQRGASTAELERRLAHWAHTRESQPA